MADDGSSEAEGLLYVSKKVLSEVTETLKKAKPNFTEETIMQLFDPGDVADDEILVPIDLSGAGDFEDPEDMIEKVGLDGVAKVFVDARMMFLDCIAKLSEAEKEHAPQEMTGAEYKIMALQEGEGGESEACLDADEDGEEESDDDAEDAEPAAKKQKTESYYKQIDGVKYDRKLLVMAEELSKSGGVISYGEAKDLWDDAQDGKGVTDCEKKTLEYTLKEFKYTDKAAKFMKESLSEGKRKSYYKQIDGVKYDRELLESVEAAAKTGGVVSDEEAHRLWEEAQDGTGVTDCEKRTFEHTLKNFKYTDKAAGFLRGKLDAATDIAKEQAIKRQRIDGAGA